MLANQPKPSGEGEVDIDSGQQSSTADIVQTSIWALAGSHRITLDETDNACIQLPWSNARSTGEGAPGYVRIVQPDPLRHHPRSSWRYGSWRGEWDIDGEVDASRASPVGDRKGPTDSHTRQLLTRKAPRASRRIVQSYTNTHGGSMDPWPRRDYHSLSCGAMHGGI